MGRSASLSRLLNRSIVRSAEFGRAGCPRLAPRHPSQPAERRSCLAASRALVSLSAPPSPLAHVIPVLVPLVLQSTFAYDEFVPLISSSLVVAVTMSTALYLSSLHLTNDGPSSYLSTHGQTGNRMSATTAAALHSHHATSSAHRPSYATHSSAGARHAHCNHRCGCADALRHC